jgi:hypothetical protein
MLIFMGAAGMNQIRDLRRQAIGLATRHKQPVGGLKAVGDRYRGCGVLLVVVSK